MTISELVKNQVVCGTNFKFNNDKVDRVMRKGDRDETAENVKSFP